MRISSSLPLSLPLSLPPIAQLLDFYIKALLISDQKAPGYVFLYLYPYRICVHTTLLLANISIEPERRRSLRSLIHHIFWSFKFFCAIFSSRHMIFSSEGGITKKKTLVAMKIPWIFKQLLLDHCPDGDLSDPDRNKERRNSLFARLNILEKNVRRTQTILVSSWWHTCRSMRPTRYWSLQQHLNQHFLGFFKYL